jgi:hypothetical protein
VHNNGVTSLLVTACLLLASAVPTRSRPPKAIPTVAEPALLGLSVNVPESASAAARQAALEEVRRAGVSMFALEVSWPDAERSPNRHDVAGVTRAARLLRQSGAVLHLDLPLVDGRGRVVPTYLATTRFDDPRFAMALGRLLDALGPALLDFSTLSLGNEADSYFADKPVELAAYRRLVAGAIEFLGRKTPRLLVGVSTAAPMDSRAPAVASALQDRSTVLLYLYAPFRRDEPFVHRPPDTLEGDWTAILRAAGRRPVAFTETSFSSSPVNGSSPAAQAEFVRRVNRFLASTSRSKLLFARYVPWRDPEPGPTASIDRRAAFLANRGLQGVDGSPKPAWRELAAPARR